MKRPTVADVRAALWAGRALRLARAALAEDALGRPDLPTAPVVGLAASRGVEAVLGRPRVTCLERVTVRQAWFAAHGGRHDVVIGVRHPDDFAAHAWLEGTHLDAAAESRGRGYLELVRHVAR